MTVRRLDQHDDLVVQLKELVIVRELLRAGGAPADGIDSDILRVSEELTRRTVF